MRLFMEISFTINLDPVAKGRPRFGKFGTYTPNATRFFERNLALLASKHRPKMPLDGPLDVKLLFQLKKPRSVKRIQPSVKPDLDNYVKATLDALKEFWTNDSQIVSLYAKKQYGLIPFIQIQIQKSQPVVDE